MKEAWFKFAHICTSVIIHSFGLLFILILLRMFAPEFFNTKLTLGIGFAMIYSYDAVTRALINSDRDWKKYEKDSN